MAALGFNTSQVYWWDAIPPAQIDQTLESVGIHGRGGFLRHFDVGANDIGKTLAAEGSQHEP